MNLRVYLYAACMLLTGSINTIATKYQDLSVVGQKPDGTPLLFQHPAFQSACMFLGEALCLVPYFILRWRKRHLRITQGLPPKVKPPTSFYIKRTLAFAVPTLCDAAGTTLLNIGLFYTFASTYQMLRGTLVLFTGFLTVMLLKRRLYLHHWLGMVLITAGAAIVGAASMLTPTAHPTPQPSPARHTPDVMHSLMHSWSDEAPAAGMHTPGAVTGAMSLHWPGLYAGSSSGDSGLDAGDSRVSVSGALRGWRQGLPAEALGPLFGNAMVILAQGFTALQFILEEKFLGQYRMQPLLAVGIEGTWGVVLCFAALPLLNMVHTASGQPVDDAVSAFQAMVDVPGLRYAVIGSIFSIGAFNFFGLSVTQALSGASRATIDACRTIFIWVFSLVAGWEAFKELQVVGFLVLLSGTSLYNELLRSCLPGGSGRVVDDDDDDDTGPETSYRSAAKPGGWSNGSGADPEAGTGSLAEPLLGGAGGGAPGTHRMHSQSQRIVTVQGSAHQVQRVHTMARSMRLGYNALSPHDLADDEEDDTLPVNLADVTDPMVLASTPYFGQQGGFQRLMSDAVSSTSAVSPRASMSDLDEVAHQAGTHPQFYLNTGRAGSSGGGLAGSTPNLTATAQQEALLGPAPHAPTGLPPPAPAGDSAQPKSSIAAAAAARAVAPRPGGGFAAFMAARQTELQQQQQPSQPPEPPPRG